MARNIVPRTDKGSDLGTPTKRWNTVYTDKLEATIVKGGNLGAVEQSAGDEVTLRSLIATAGSNPTSITIYNDIPITTTDLTIPSNIFLRFKDAGKLSPEAGITLTINGSIEAGLWQVFGTSGTIVGNILNEIVFPEWFGNDLARTVSVCGSNNVTIRITKQLTISSDLTIPDNIELDFGRGGKLSADTSITVTLNCGIRAGAWHIFDGAGTFDGSPLVDAIYAEWFGAIGDGTTDDTAALQAAANFCGINSSSFTLKTLKKTYIITSTLQIRCNADMSESTIHCDGSFSPAIRVGSETEATFRLSFKGPDILNTTKTLGNGWGASEVPFAGAVGLQAMNLYECDFTNTRVQHFCVGLQIAAKGSHGNVYNTYRVGTLVNNQVNLQITPLDDSGWTNQNYFENGRLYFYSAETDNTNTRQVEIKRNSLSGNSPNGNTFVGLSLESSFVEYMVYIWGSYNTFIGCRWEGDSDKVAFYGEAAGTESVDNVFISGYNGFNVANGNTHLGYGGSYNLVLGGRYPLQELDGTTNRGIRYYGNAFVPRNDNIMKFGCSTNRWTELFAATGAINTSDAREKTELLSITEAEKRVALKIKASIGKFKFLDAIEKKGKEKARIHFGTTAQKVAEIFKSEGLNPDDYSLFCYDEWEADPENGIKAGNRYGLRYTELLAFIIAAM